MVIDRLKRNKNLTNQQLQFNLHKKSEENLEELKYHLKQLREKDIQNYMQRLQLLNNDIKKCKYDIKKSYYLNLEKFKWKMKNILENLLNLQKELKYNVEKLENEEKELRKCLINLMKAILDK